MLIHRSGTEFEDMYWIDLDEIRVIAEETNSLVKKRIIYSNKIIKKSQSCKNIIIIHSHPDSFPPSIADFNSNYDHNYVVGIVACHNGKLYMYSANERINEDYYKLVVEGFLKIGYNEEEAQIKALENLQINFYIKFKEVTDYKKMSVSELEREKARLLKEIKASVSQKKQVRTNKKNINFNF